MVRNGKDTTAHLEIGFRFHPVGYEPKFKNAFIGLGNGVDINVVRDWLGHQEISTTAMYLHVRDDRKKAAANKIDLLDD